MLHTHTASVSIHDADVIEDGTGFKHDVAFLAVPDSPGRCCSVHSWRRSRNNPSAGGVDETLAAGLAYGVPRYPPPTGACIPLGATFDLRAYCYLLDK